MKTDDKNKKFKRKREFRFHSVVPNTKKGKNAIKEHPTFVFLQNGDIYIYVQLTHSKRIKGKVLIKLKKNPNPLDIRDSYYIEEICKDKMTNFGRNRKNWKIAKSDETRIRALVKK